eukprot:UN07786
MFHDRFGASISYINTIKNDTPKRLIYRGQLDWQKHLNIKV